MGEMRRAIAREQADNRMQDRFTSTIIICAAIVTSIRLARASGLSPESQEVANAISDAVRLARYLVRRVAK